MSIKTDSFLIGTEIDNIDIGMTINLNSKRFGTGTLGSIF